MPCCCHWHLCLLPALSRRSGDVGSLLPPRSSRSKPRTPLSIRRRPVRIVGRKRSPSVQAADADYVRLVRPYPRVVIVGGGFGGLQCAKALRDKPVDVLLVDRRNYHLFTPLLYQVASCLLNPSEITAPLRKVLRGAPNVRYRAGDVVGVDFERKRVRLSDDVRRQLGNEVRQGLPVSFLFWLVEQGQLPAHPVIAASLPDFVLATLCGTRPATD